MLSLTVAITCSARSCITQDTERYEAKCQHICAAFNGEMLDVINNSGDCSDRTDSCTCVIAPPEQVGQLTDRDDHAVPTRNEPEILCFDYRWRSCTKKQQ